MNANKVVNYFAITVVKMKWEEVTSRKEISVTLNV